MKQKMNIGPLSGFMELLPEDQLLLDNMKSVIRDVYKQFGFFGLDTPLIERSEILLAKAGGDTEKQIYRFTKGSNDLSLRFDLTVPLARYVAHHYNDLVFPFKRYQIGKVFRGERAQKGRYREFYQSDIDIIGDGKLSFLYDAELPAVIYNIFKKLGFDNFTIKINNRKILNGVFEDIGQKETSQEIMRIIDKIDKIGLDGVSEELKKSGLEEKAYKKVISFISISGTNFEKMKALKAIDVQNETYQKGLEELEVVIKRLESLGIPEENYVIDPSIARGLDYYTGTVYETFLNDYPKIGSVCSGGRYEDLAGHYTNKKLPGVGVSIGLTRLFYQLQQMKFFKEVKKRSVDVVVIPFIEYLDESFQIASRLRKEGLNVSVYMEDTKIGKKFKYADRIKSPFVLTVGENEVQSKKYTLKNLQTGNQEQKTVEELIVILKSKK